MARRIERRAESRFGDELGGLEEWQAQGGLKAVMWGFLEGLRRGEGWNLDSILEVDDDGDGVSFAD